MPDPGCVNRGTCQSEASTARRESSHDDGECGHSWADRDQLTKWALTGRSSSGAIYWRLDRKRCVRGDTVRSTIVLSTPPSAAPFKRDGLEHGRPIRTVVDSRGLRRDHFHGRCAVPRELARTRRVPPRGRTLTTGKARNHPGFFCFAHHGRSAGLAHAVLFAALAHAILFAGVREAAATDRCRTGGWARPAVPDTRTLTA